MIIRFSQISFFLVGSLSHPKPSRPYNKVGVTVIIIPLSVIRHVWSSVLREPPILSSTCGAGSVTEIGGLKAYVTGPFDSKLAILLVSDIYGFEAPNFRHLEPRADVALEDFCKSFLLDKTAAVAGFYAVVPDFFYGDPFIPDKTERPVWLQYHGTDKGFEDAKVVIAALRNKGISTIGAAGFCWGGKVVVELKSDCIQAAVLLHPSRVTVGDIKEVKVPIAILGAEFDKMYPPELLKQFEEVLSTKPEVSSYVKIFPDVPHGWTVRYKDEDETAVKLANEAQQDMLDWLTKYVQ